MGSLGAAATSLLQFNLYFASFFCIAISISYSGCQISMLTFGIGNCIAFTSISSKLHCFIVSRDSCSHLYIVAVWWLMVVELSHESKRTGVLTTDSVAVYHVHCAVSSLLNGTSLTQD